MTPTPTPPGIPTPSTFFWRSIVDCMATRVRVLRGASYRCEFRNFLGRLCLEAASEVAVDPDSGEVKAACRTHSAWSRSEV